MPRLILLYSNDLEKANYSFLLVTLLEKYHGIKFELKVATDINQLIDQIKIEIMFQLKWKGLISYEV